MDKKAIIQRQFEKLAQTVVDQAHAGPLLVGIDGIPASGKTTLADRLAPLIEALGRPVVRASLDGYHNPAEVRYEQGKDSPQGYFDDSFNYDALVKTLLSPLSDTNTDPQELPIAAYDYREDSTVKNRYARFQSDTIMLFDGVMLFREEINDYWHYRIYVDARYETGFVRGVPRDAHNDDDQMIVGKKYLNRYFPGERIYRASAQPLKKADAIIFNDDPETCIIKYTKNTPE